MYINMQRSQKHNDEHEMRQNESTVFSNLSFLISKQGFFHLRNIDWVPTVYQDLRQEGYHNGKWKKETPSS